MSVILPKSPDPSKAGQNGFTLLELLIALSLMVILSGALYGSYFGLIKGRERAVEGMEARRELRFTLDLLRRELSGAMYSKNAIYFTNEVNPLHFVVEDRDLFGKPASALSFITLAPPDGSGRAVSDQIDLKYQVQESSGKLLLTRQTRDLHFSGDAGRYPQMESLEGFLVECLSGDKWVKSWDTAINQGLPSAVRVTIRVKEGDKTFEYSTIATPRIPVS